MKSIGIIILSAALSGCAIYSAKPYPKPADAAAPPERAPVMPVEQKITHRSAQQVVQQKLPSPADMAVPLNNEPVSTQSGVTSIAPPPVPAPSGSGPRTLGPKAASESTVMAAPAPAPAKTPVPATAAAPSSDAGFTMLLNTLLAEQPAAPTLPAPEFLWPLEGEIVADFGPQKDGATHNGINIAGPKGAPVRASASGTVIYADSTVPGYGNLVIIRHLGGWLSAYGHLERMVVAENGILAAGDLLGTLGQTGDVASPQLHFEIRRQENAVDPIPLLPPSLVVGN